MWDVSHLQLQTYYYRIINSTAAIESRIAEWKFVPAHKN